MQDVFSFNSFSDFLSSKYEEAVQKSPGYSLRSFANELGISPSRLSEIFNGQKLSVRTAEKVLDLYSVFGERRAYLLHLVNRDSARSLKGRRIAQSKADRFESRKQFKVADPTSFDVLSKWYVPMIAELVTQQNSRSVEEIADFISIEVSEVFRAIGVLSDHGIIVKSRLGKWTLQADLLKFESPEIRSTAIRSFHRQIIQLSLSALETQAIEERKFLSGVCMIRPDMLQQARIDLENFSSEFIKRYSSSSGEVAYALALQLFRLSKPKK